ncbi:hypothetical protein CS8_022350 [Cupriavidus sp. 8B]
MRVADLQEKGDPCGNRLTLRRGGKGQFHRRENTAGQDKHRARTTESETLQRAAARRIGWKI